MKKLESLKDEKFANLESYKISNLAAIVGGAATRVDTGKALWADWSYGASNGSDGCLTRISDGDTETMHSADNCQ